MLIELPDEELRILLRLLKYISMSNSNPNTLMRNQATVLYSAVSNNMISPPKVSSLIIFCNKCRKQIQEPGGLFFSPPTGNNVAVDKFHLCTECFESIKHISCIYSDATPP
jgi:hypothetical protein